MAMRRPRRTLRPRPYDTGTGSGSSGSSSRRSHHHHRSQYQQHQQQQQGSMSAAAAAPTIQAGVPLEILPVKPQDEDGWRLQLSHSGKLFWHHPEHGQQWNTPDAVHPCRWRVCHHTDGSTTFCNMETGEQHDKLPVPQPLDLFDDPRDWVEEKATDGTVTWFNPRFMLVSLVRPPSHKEGASPFCHWFSIEAPGKGRGYVHKFTREVIYRDITQERRQRMAARRVDEDVNASETALGRKLVDYDAHIKSVLKQKKGSLRSVALRKTFFDKIKLEYNPDGTANLAFRDTNRIICTLSEDEADLYQQNPHIRQVFMNQRAFRRPNRSFTQEDRIVHTDDEGRLAPRTPYARRQGEAKTTEFWFPRQVFLQDIEFLTAHGHVARTVVVVSGPGVRHYNVLAEKYFPQHDFIIYCPEPIECEATRQIELRPKAFDLDEAEEFRNMNILFMCSFRSATDHSDNHLAETMRLQEKWMNFLRPAASRLRFFLPWPSKRGEGGATEYIDGQLRFPLWGINTGTECTMFVTDPEARRTFSFRDFEGLMFHHNVITRTTYYEHSVQGEGLDHCYDCSAEIFILSQWIRSANPGLDEEEVRREVSKLSYDISRIISNGSRTLKVT